MVKRRERSSLLSPEILVGEEEKTGGRSCSDAVVGRRAAASELFF
jgi:hypothetical protein